MQYMRMPQNKFWAWVAASAIAGLAVGLAAMFITGASATSRIAALETRLAGTSMDASASVAAAEGRVAQAEATVASLTAQSSQLSADLAAVQAELAAAEKKPAVTATATIAVTSRTILPGTVDASHTITLTAKVTGKPDHVTMRIYNSSKSYDRTFTLHKASTSGSTETWHVTTKAPGKAGAYKYYATAIEGSKRVTKVGASPGTLTVK